MTTYRIDPGPPEARSGDPRVRDDATIIIVGCGGTGSFLAEAIARLLIGRRADLYLVDHDRVEPHNVGRQAFDQSDVGRFKAEALAFRLAWRFNRQLGYALGPYSAELHARLLRDSPSRLKLVVGCVDNAAARRAIAATLGDASAYGTRPRIWLLDCGNGHNAGQVLLGNATRPDQLRGAFVPEEGVCRALPAPTLQRPDLLASPPAPRPAPDCAEAIEAGEQGRTINLVVAAIAASFVEKLLDGTCTWMGSYFDLDDGTLRCLPADPKTVAEIAGLHLNAVVARSAPSAS